MGNRSAIVIEGFLLQARNIHLCIPIFLIAVAYTTVSALGYSTVVKSLLTKVFHHAEDLWFRGANPVWPSYDADLVDTRIRAGHLVAACTAYLLITTFTTGPAVQAVAVSAAVTACSGERRSSSLHALVRKLLAGGDGLKGPLGTALLGHVLHTVACRGAILVFGLHTAFFLKYNANPVLLSMQLLLFLLGHLFALYMELVCTLAVVVSAAEPASCFYGVRALWQAWWIMAEKTTPAVILLFVKGAVKAIVETVSIRVVYVHPAHYYTVAYAILSRFVYISLCAALELWFVSATTVYYYRCRQRNDAYYSSI